MPRVREKKGRFSNQKPSWTGFRCKRCGLTADWWGHYQPNRAKAKGCSDTQYPMSLYSVPKGGNVSRRSA